MFDIKDDRTSVTIDFLEEDLSEEVIICLRDIIKNLSSTRKIGMNLINVKSAKNGFFSLLKEFYGERDIALYNMTADINLLLFLMNYNKYANLFVNEIDFKDNSRCLIKRGFRVCAS